MISDLSGLVMNIMISLDFEKDKLLPSLTLVELGNQAFAQDGEDDGEGSYCQHNVSGNDGIANYCSINECKALTGQGSNVGKCGSY